MSLTKQNIKRARVRLTVVLKYNTSLHCNLNKKKAQVNPLGFARAFLSFILFFLFSADHPADTVWIFKAREILAPFCRTCFHIHMTACFNCTAVKTFHLL